MKVFVYYNLHKHCWSIKALEGDRKGRVIAHKDHLWLHDCTFKVSQSGRERVIRERRKNVHAGVIGQWHENEKDPASWIIPFVDLMEEVTYNPYKYETFVFKSNSEPVENEVLVLMTDRRVFVI